VEAPEMAMIRAELERLQKALKNCADSGLRKWIEGAIEKQKQKLTSGNNPDSVLLFHWNIPVP
jgi:hypothetical protein